MNKKINVYLINLDGSDDRLQNATRELNQQGIKFIRFPAFDGRKLIPIELSEYDEQKTLSYMGRQMKGGEIGCYFSHLNCAKEFLNSDADFAIVLEDDMLAEDFLLDNITQMLVQLEQMEKPWYIINIGALKRKIFTPLFKVRHHEVSHAHYFPMTTTGIVWNKTGAKAFVENALPIYAPVDNFLRDWLTKNNMGLAVYPPFVKAKDGESDIDNGSQRNQHNRTALYGLLKQKRLWRDKIIACKHKFLD